MSDQKVDVIPARRMPEDDLSGVRYKQTKPIKISKSQLKENRIISGMDLGVEMDAYRKLRTRVLKKMKKNNWNVLAVTSPAPGAGKTLTAINLAISIAMEVDKTVLLIDADLRQSRVNKYFGLPETMLGLSDYLTSDISLERLLINPGIGRLIILPGGKLMHHSSEILSSPKMKRLVEEVKSRYESRYVIFDLPPMLASDDAMGFAPLVDATLLVVEDGVANIDELKSSIELLEDANLIGTVLNKSREPVKDYYYGKY
ncbi:Tyrosine-protein kinase EpsD [hydrothermal vent metagenome]|uniref:Tyrosine-protein kinase EpsD n=1 Tax=hydrothermal vent metagenome TaxID=652676 RepID=A0A3B0Z1H7_9ZZZZ